MSRLKVSFILRLIAQLSKVPGTGSVIHWTLKNEIIHLEKGDVTAKQR